MHTDAHIYIYPDMMHVCKNANKYICTNTKWQKLYKKNKLLATIRS